MSKFQKNVKTTLGSLCFALLAWVAPTALNANDVEWPQVRLDQNSNAVAIWDVVDQNSMRSIVSASQPSGGSWATPTTISTSGIDSFYPLISMNNSGDCVAVWGIIDPVWGITSIVGAMYDHTTATWSTPSVLSTSNELVDQNYDCRIDINGNVAVVWKSLLLSDYSNVIYSASATIGGSWSAPVAISQ